jgi:hypothetical protein
MMDPHTVDLCGVKGMFDVIVLALVDLRLLVLDSFVLRLWW